MQQQTGYMHSRSHTAMRILKLNIARNVIKLEGICSLSQTICTAAWRFPIETKIRVNGQKNFNEWEMGCVWEHRLGERAEVIRRANAWTSLVLTSLWTILRAEGWLKECLLTPAFRISKLSPNLSLCHSRLSAVSLVEEGDLPLPGGSRPAYHLLLIFA